MAIEGEAQSFTLTPIERTWRVTLFCDAKTPQAAWRVEFNRGSVMRDAEGHVFGDENQTVATVHRTFGQIVAQAIPDGPRSIATYADLMQLIADCGDAFRQEDLTPAEPEGGE
jgi:hypothetical protein